MTELKGTEKETRVRVMYSVAGNYYDVTDIESMNYSLFDGSDILTTGEYTKEQIGGFIWESEGAWHIDECLAELIILSYSMKIVREKKEK